MTLQGSAPAPSSQEARSCSESAGLCFWVHPQQSVADARCAACWVWVSTCAVHSERPCPPAPPAWPPRCSGVFDSSSHFSPALSPFPATSPPPPHLASGPLVDSNSPVCALMVFFLSELDLEERFPCTDRGLQPSIPSSTPASQPGFPLLPAEGHGKHRVTEVPRTWMGSHCSPSQLFASRHMI